MQTEQRKWVYVKKITFYILQIRVYYSVKISERQLFVPISGCKCILTFTKKIITISQTYTNFCSTNAIITNKDILTDEHISSGSSNVSFY